MYIVNLFIILICIQSLCVIIAQNAITSVLFMIGCYLTVSFLFFILGAEFLAVYLLCCM